MEPVTVIIETPKGSAQKYDFDVETGKMKLKKVMPSGMVFPFDFGFIPGTLGGDGDPLDVMVVSELTAFAGCVMDCRIIGGLKAVQQERDGEEMRNDRLIAIPEVSQQYAGLKELREFPGATVDQIVAFFTSYNEQAGKQFRVLQKLSAVKAYQIIEKSRKDLPQSRLVEIFLPMYDNNGVPFPEKLYTGLRDELNLRFGGLTEYSRSPAKGFWKPEKNNISRDKLLVFEVMCVKVEAGYWDKLKARLLKTFKQESIVIRCSEIELW